MSTSWHLRPPSTRSRGSLESWRSWLEEAFADRPDRCSHSLAVGHRAAIHARLELRHLGRERLHRFVLAAHLHDIGRALDPDDREPHGFVGGRFLDALGLHDLAPFVAHHSGARHEAKLRGQSHLDRWLDPDPELQAVLTHLDRTTSSTGEPVTLTERRTELVRRYGADSIEVAVFDHALDEVEHGRLVLRDHGRTAISLGR